MTDQPKETADRGLARAATGTALTAPNPQGKGLVGFLLDWAYSSPRGVVAKPAPQVLADYFTSLLVLSAKFRFKPVFNTDYYLYWKDPDWLLSLIGPDEWGTPEKQQGFAGVCVLHEDATWSISPSDNVVGGGPVARAVGQFYLGFVQRLGSDRPLEQGLPSYERQLPYYQRLFAAALGRSLRGSLARGDQLGRPSAAWLAGMPHDARQLLVAPGTD